MIHDAIDAFFAEMDAAIEEEDVEFPAEYYAESDTDQKIREHAEYLATLKPCKRCGTKGGGGYIKAYGHVDNGRCFECN